MLSVRLFVYNQSVYAIFAYTLENMVYLCEMKCVIVIHRMPSKSSHRYGTIGKAKMLLFIVLRARDY